MDVGDDALPLSWENIFTRNQGARQAALSPDGARVAVTASTPDVSGIFRVAVDRDPEPTPWVEGASPVGFADNSGIVFARDGDLWRVAAGSSEPTRITRDAEDERAARPSPDGSTIAFYSGRSGHQDIWTVAADGSASPVRLTQASMAADDFRFAPWSPDGTRIAFDPQAGTEEIVPMQIHATDWLHNHTVRTGHGGAPGERTDTYAISNTLARVPNVVTPTLIMHGEADVRAPLRQYELAVEILEKEGP